MKLFMNLVKVPEAKTDLKAFYSYHESPSLKELSCTLSTEQFDLLSESTNLDTVQRGFDNLNEKKAFKSGNIICYF
ncbi:hypothetical protein [Alkalicoccobacillus murimartini]|uniref:Uncharacterized protein n=1 Tax=Alkalicoccobacillus murimartini TaxID=171685 RepID=A0ABT9YKB2_9BACI|nr:hypothetical protein [Alkalicoccobacillus murimartini]MDQ0208292.1 hypothetical protein [Alkalicoccobacillus murimartini]